MNITKEIILTKLKQLKPYFEEEGIILLGLFGSYANGNFSKYSDIDIAYKINYDKFSKKYKGGFSKLIKIDDIKKELEKQFQKPVDFVSDSNKKIIQGLLYV
jgi:predicted nucleotidyltransferase